MGIDDYFRIEKPEEKSPTSPKSFDKVIESALEVWMRYTESVLKNSFDFTSIYNDQLVAEAVKILAPHQDTFPKTFTVNQAVIDGVVNSIVPKTNLPRSFSYYEASEFIDTLRQACLYETCGLFFTQLLNLGMEKLHVPVNTRINNCGYKLSQGTLEFHGSNIGGLSALGEYAMGGTIINYSMDTCMGRYATGGSFVNYGDIEYGYLKGDILILNYNYLNFAITTNFVINHGIISHLNLDKGTCINFGTITKYLSGHVIDPVRVWPRKKHITKWHLLFNRKLTSLVEELYTATKPGVALDMEKIQEQGEKIKVHCA